MSEFEGTSESRLHNLLTNTGNTKCGDCDGLSPTWASINNGVFICTSCAGVHRSLGVEYSFVQSIKLDNWSDESVEAMAKKFSTAFVNETFLEYSVPGQFRKPHPDSCQKDRSAYIRAKYVDRIFLPGTGKSRCPPLSLEPTEENSSARTVGEVEFVGVLMINLLSAKNLINSDVVGLSDPYVVMNLGSQQIKSRRVLNNLSPVFNERLMLAWNGDDDLRVTVFDEDNFTADGKLCYLQVCVWYLIYSLLFIPDNIGCCTVELRSLQLPNDGAALDLDLPLEGVAHGSVQLELSLQRFDH